MNTRVKSTAIAALLTAAWLPVTVAAAPAPAPSAASQAAAAVFRPASAPAAARPAAPVAVASPVSLPASLATPPAVKHLPSGNAPAASAAKVAVRPALGAAGPVVATVVSGKTLPAPAAGAVQPVRNRSAQPAEARMLQPVVMHALPNMDVWNVRRDRDLRDQLYDWTQRAGWGLVWDSEYSYVIQASAVFQGDFTSAVQQLFDALGDLDPPLYPEIYEGNRVLVVKSQPRQ